MADGKLRFFDRLRRTRVYHPGTYKTLPKRVNWEQIEANPPKEKKNVVKGLSKRIVVVKSPDPKVFDEAIFIVKEDFLGRAGRADVLREAQQAANAYIRGAVPPKGLGKYLKPVLFGLIGAVLSALALVLIYYL